MLTLVDGSVITVDQLAYNGRGMYILSLEVQYTVELGFVIASKCL